MDEICEMLSDLTSIITIQAEAIKKLSLKLLEYISLEEVSKLYDDTKARELADKWQS